MRTLQSLVERELIIVVVTLRRKKIVLMKAADSGPRPPWSAEAGSVYLHPEPRGRGCMGTCSEEERGAGRC